MNTATHHAMLDFDANIEIQGKIMLGVELNDRHEFEAAGDSRPGTAGASCSAITSRSAGIPSSSGRALSDRY